MSDAHNQSLGGKQSKEGTRPNMDVSSRTQATISCSHSISSGMDTDTDADDDRPENLLLGHPHTHVDAGGGGGGRGADTSVLTARMGGEHPRPYAHPHPHARPYTGNGVAEGEANAVLQRTRKKKKRRHAGYAEQKHQNSFHYKMRQRAKKLSRFASLKLLQLLCVVYIVCMTFASISAYSTGNAQGLVYSNGSYRAVAANDVVQLSLLLVARISAFSMYPVMVAVFLSKCKSIKSFFSRTPLSMYMVTDDHELHVYAGYYIAFAVWIHGAAHLVRWGLQNNMSLLWTHRTGLSGLAVIGVTPLITFPMMYWKKQMSYEVRKALHYLFYAFAIGLVFHVPVTAIPNGGFIAPVLGASIVIYTLDAAYVYMFLTERIETTTFQVLPSGVQMSMYVSDAFQNRMGQGGFAYVCLPWVDRNQWHAFSLFESSEAKNRREVFMLKTGDWTRSVHRALQRNTVRPVWVQGPFENPYNNAIMFDNQILVATGIGITPALSVIRAHQDSRRINLIWACRDASMLEFFLEHLYLDHSGWNLIFYTGRAPLNPAVEELNTNVRVIKSRPNLHYVIPNIIYGIESGNGLPEKYVPAQLERVVKVLIERTNELDRDPDVTTEEKLRDLTALARTHGFLFTDLLNQLPSPDDEEWFVESEDASPTSSTDEADGGGGGDGAPLMATTKRNNSLLSAAEARTKGLRHRQTTPPKLDADDCLQKIRLIGAKKHPDPIVRQNSLTNLDAAFDVGELRSIVANEQDVAGGGDSSEAFVPMKRRGSLDHVPFQGEPQEGVLRRGSLERNHGICDVGMDTARRAGGGAEVVDNVVSLKAGTFDFGDASHDDHDDVKPSPAPARRGLKRRSSLVALRKRMGVKQLDSTFKPWEKHDEAGEYVQDLDEDLVLSTWGIMYCGGSTPVERALTHISHQYKVSLNVESFEW